MVEHVLTEDFLNLPMSAEVARELADYGIIYPCGEPGDPRNERAGACSTDDEAVYHVAIEWEHLDDDTIIALSCDGLSVIGDR